MRGSYLYARLFFRRHRLYGSGRTYRAAAIAGNRTEPVGKCHYRLHEAVERCAGTQNAIGTFADTQLAGGAMTAQMIKTRGSGRNSRSGFGIAFFTAYRSEASVGHLLRRLHCCSSRYYSGAYHECAADTVRLLFRSGSAGGRLAAAGCKTIAYCALRTIVDAVHADHTSAVVDLMFFCIDTLGFAVTAAAAAAVTAVDVDHRLEKRKPRKEAEYRADRNVTAATAATAILKLARAAGTSASKI